MTFVDFTDVYTSFLFNLLSNSLAIKNSATRITEYAQDNTKYPELAGEIAKIIRIIFDFDSSNAASLNGSSSLLDFFKQEKYE
jgi:hypothetical protein